MNGDFVKMYRSFLEWEWYSDINTSRLFLHMLLKANWRDSKFQGITVPRGSFISSIGRLAEETALTDREIRTAVSHLKMTGEVTSRPTNRYTVFTVVNYNLYQSDDKQSDDQLTGNRHSNDNLTTTIEEKKEEKKERKKIKRPPKSPAAMLDQFLSAYPMKSRMVNHYLTEIAYIDCLMTQKITELELVTAATNYADRCRILKTDSHFVKKPENFLRDLEYCQYLPGVYQPPMPKPGTDANKGMMRQDYGDLMDLEKELLSN